MTMVETMSSTAVIPADGKSDDKSKNASLSIPTEIASKHMLQNTWTIWFFKNDKMKQWEENQRIITTFDTVEDFWAIYNHIQVPSRLSVGCDYSLFKEGIKPMWEDTRNRSGGRWLVNLTKQQRTSELDRLWLETLLCLIGESFGDESEQICGTVVNMRGKGDKIALWSSTAENSESVLKIGRTFKERLNLPPKFSIAYEQHIDTASKQGSQTKNKFVV